MNLTVKIRDVIFSNPVTVASGTFGHAEKYYDLEEVKQLGAIVPKTVTFQAQAGNPPPRIIETPSGMLNAIGIENPGPDVFIEKKLPLFRKIGVPLIISILGYFWMHRHKRLPLTPWLLKIKGKFKLQDKIRS